MKMETWNPAKGNTRKCRWELLPNTLDIRSLNIAAEDAADCRGTC